MSKHLAYDAGPLKEVTREGVWSRGTSKEVTREDVWTQGALKT